MQQTAGTVNGGTSTFNLTQTLTTTPWNKTGGTFNGSGTTIVFATASTSTRTFAGNGSTYGTLTYTVANSPGSLTITGANTFNTINVGSGRILTMPASTTNTFTTFNVNGANNGYLQIPGGGLANTSASTPDSAALSIIGDIDVRYKLAPVGTWVSLVLGGKDDGFGVNREWQLQVSAPGTVVLTWWDSGGTLQSATSTAAVGTVFGSGVLGWLRFTLQVNNGAGGSNIKFYTSPDGTTWTQLGSTVTKAFTTSIRDQAAAVTIGATATVTGTNAANFYRAQIRNNILDDGTGIVFDADFTTKAFGANTFVESSVNAATVTINGTLAQAGDGRVSLVSSTPGTQATVNKAGGGLVTNVDYLTIQDSKATPSSTWYAGVHSINVSNNTGWNFNTTVTDAGGFFHVL